MIFNLNEDSHKSTYAEKNSNHFKWEKKIEGNPIK